eukprot:17264-Heterococcus_DN1.PRE.4
MLAQSHDAAAAAAAATAADAAAVDCSSVSALLLPLTEFTNQSCVSVELVAEARLRDRQVAAGR